MGLCLLLSPSTGCLKLHLQDSGLLMKQKPPSPFAELRNPLTPFARICHHLPSQQTPLGTVRTIQS